MKEPLFVVLLALAAALVAVLVTSTPPAASIAGYGDVPNERYYSEAVRAFAKTWGAGWLSIPE